MRYSVPALLFAAACAPANDQVAVEQEVTVSTIVDEIQASGGVSVGPDGNVYVGDFGPNWFDAGGANIYRIAPDGSSVEIINSEFGGASGNAFGADGYLYQNDIGTGEAYRIAMDGTRTRIAAELQTPVGIAPRADGVTYVTNCMTHRIQRINADGTTDVLAEGSPLNCPNGMAFGGDGALYSVNFRDDALVRIDPESGEMAVVSRFEGFANGHLGWANDRFYISSFRAGRIYSVTLDGEICHIAGSGEKGNDDGDGLSASFFRPNGAAITADGNTLFTNPVNVIVEEDDPQLYPNSIRRVDGLLSMLDCPEDRRIIAD